ncbi:MAG: CaiB/BaiF CoA transferase family protein [Flavobacteriaceae bacterium]
MNRTDQIAAVDALAGIRIVDLTQVAAGPYATSLLGDFGAEVVKVEPVTGEPFRVVDNMYGPTDSGYFFGLNRSKRAVAVDLKAEEGRDIVDRLLAQADVVAVSMRPRTLAGIGLDYEDIRRRFPRLIYCSITAFGDTGPRANQPGMDILAQAVGGIMGLTGEPGGPPVKVGPPITDFATSFLACFGILAALRSRDMTGQGQRVSVNLLDTSIAMLANFVTPYLKSNVPVRPVGGGHPQMVPYQTFLTRDGARIVVACLTETFWRNLCVALGREELSIEDGFKTNSARLVNRDRLIGILDGIFVERDASEWEEILNRHDVPVAKVNRLEDAIEDAQTIHNGMITTLRHPRYGDIPVVNNPVHLDGTPPHPRRYPPGIGENTDEVLGELGLSEDDIHHLRVRGIIR